MKQGQRLSYQGHDVALFPMEVMKVTTVPGEVGTTHESTMNIDISGADSGVSNMFAPWGMRVVKNNNTANHEIIWWSTDLVKCADGKTRLLTMRTLHDDDVSDLTVGRVFTQGEICTQEGNTGDSHGNHIHMGIAEGHTTSLVKQASGYRDLVGAIDPRSVFFINDTIIKSARGMKWETYVEPYAPMVDIVGKTYIASANVWIREQPSTSSNKLLLLPANHLVDVLQISANKQDGYDWVKIKYENITGYCAIVKEATVSDVVPEIVIPTPQPEPEIVVVPVVEPEPVEPVIQLEPVQEPSPPVEQVIEEVPNIAPKPQETVTEPCDTTVEPVQPPQTEVKPNLLQIILNIIAIIVRVLTTKYPRK